MIKMRKQTLDSPSLPNVLPIQSTGIIGGAMMVKVPQIRRILSAKSAKGLQFQMFLSEVAAGTVSIAYFAFHAMPLASYAEMFFVLFQNLVILGLMLILGRKNAARKSIISGVPSLLPYVAGYAFAAMIVAIAPGDVLENLYNCTTAVLVLGRAPQIYTNMKAKSTGELSAATQVLMTAGSAARVFTTQQEGGSDAMVVAYALSAGMNALMMLQMFIYRPRKARGTVMKGGVRKSTRTPKTKKRD